MIPTLVVTGAGGGIGAAVARRMVGQHRLVLPARSHDALVATRTTLGDDAEVVLVGGDLRDPATAEAIVDAATAAGPLAGLVNVAGIGPVQTDDAVEILDVGLRATVRLTTSIRPHLGAGAALVSVGSVASARAPLDADDLLLDPLRDGWQAAWADRGVGTWDAYAYTKRGLLLQTRRLAVEWAPAGVRINVVSPSQTATPLGRASIAENPEIAAFVQRIPMRRMAEPHEVAGTIAFLLGPEAGFITGIELLVDGGASAAGASLTVPR